MPLLFIIALSFFIQKLITHFFWVTWCHRWNHRVFSCGQNNLVSVFCYFFLSMWFLSPPPAHQHPLTFTPPSPNTKLLANVLELHYIDTERVTIQEKSLMQTSDLTIKLWFRTPRSSRKNTSVNIRIRKAIKHSNEDDEYSILQQSGD